MLEEKSILFNATENNKLPLKGSVFARIISDPEWNILTIFGLVLPSPLSPATTDFKRGYNERLFHRQNVDIPSVFYQY